MRVTSQDDKPFPPRFARDALATPEDFEAAGDLEDDDVDDEDLDDEDLEDLDDDVDDDDLDDDDFDEDEDDDDEYEEEDDVIVLPDQDPDRGEP